MKKSLLALAAMGAFAGAAQAQSSVTVYGILDVGYTGQYTKGVGSGLAATGAPSVPGSKSQYNGFNSGNMATSRLGFRGTEDLGGGTSAFFTAEIQLNPTNADSWGSSGSNNTSNNATVTNRQSFVGLAQKGLGNFAIGTQYTPIFNAMTAVNPGNNNTVIGSIIYPQSASQHTNSEALTVRNNNALTITTERFGGFRLQALYHANSTDRSSNTTAAAGATPGSNNSFGYGLGADFAWQKLYVTAAYQLNKTETSYYTTPFQGYLNSNDAAATGTRAVGASNATSTVAANVQDTQWLAGATYDFGILKAYVAYVNRKLADNNNSAQFAKRSGQQIGVRAPITKTVNVWANIGNGRFQAFGTSNPTANFNAWQLGSEYNLSKRTGLYAIYGQTQTSSTTNNTFGSAASQYAVGAIHRF